MFKHISRDKKFYRAMMALAVPVVLQNLINNSLSMLDTFMVGTLGEEALAGVTLANTVFFVVMLFTFGLQSGCAVLISQYWGKGDSTTINRILGIGIGLTAAVSLIVGVIVTAIPDQVYALTSNDAGLISVAADYARVVAFAQFFNGLSMMYISAQRSMENPRLGMTILIISMATNTFLNWVMIFGKLGFPAMGVKGAALATLCSRIIEFAITLIYALRTTRFFLDFKAMLRPGKVIFMDFVRFSLPVVVNETVWGFGFSLYAVIIGHMEGAVAGVAAYTITLTVERMLSAINFGVGGAAAVLVGKPLGAGDREGAHTAGVTMMAVTTIMGVAIGLLLLALTYTVVVPLVLPLFGASDQTLAIGQAMLVIVAAAMPFRSFNFCNIVGVLRGGGDVKAGVFIDIFCMYGIALPLSALAGLVWGASVVVVYLLITTEEFVKVFIGYWRFSKKKWLRNITREIA